MDLDYFQLLRESRHLDVSGLSERVRVAVLSDASVQHLVPLLRVLFARAGLDAEIYVAEFDTMSSEVLDEGSGLYRFAPDAVILLPATNAFRARYHEATGDRGQFGEEHAAATVALWDAMKRRSRATIVQATYIVPADRELGSFSLTAKDSLTANVLELNAALARAARTRGHVLLADVEGVAAWIGKRALFDERLWTMAKAYCALAHLPQIAKALVDVVIAARGRIVKFVVLDLDGTLWGGVIGDDGLDGIQIGTLGEGEPYRRFQQYLRELGRRGIALAVASKNEPAAALQPFREHPEMVLREADIAVFVASWETKVDSIRRIKETLDIGFDAIVFVDDNPFERELVRQYLPQVIVPELPEDPNDYVRALAERNLFEVTQLTEEDRKRGALYREEASRRELAASFTDVAHYLARLTMRATWTRFDTFHLPRIAQLIQRSNQFNLTTRRETPADCEALMNASSDEVVPFFLKLADRFGDHGLVSVVVGRVEADNLLVETWVMSCRVLSRGVEDFVVEKLLEAARARGLSRVVGRYEPTAKNILVKDLYARLGFMPAADEANTWVAHVDRFVARPHHILENLR